MADDRSTARRLTFTSQGTEVVGDLHLPAGSGPTFGCAVVTGPLTSVKEQAAGVYAAALARRGYVALAFDYRNFGESEGEPRQLDDPEAHVIDIFHALTALQSEPAASGQPAFALGVCFGAGPMAVAAARDNRFRAFAAVAGGFVDVRRMRSLLGDGFDETVERGREAERDWLTAGTVEVIPAVGPAGTDVAMPAPEAFDYYGTPRGAVRQYRNEFAVASFGHLLPFDSQPAAARLPIPMTMVHSERAVLVDEARGFYAKVTTAKTELWLDSQGQVDFYDDPRLIEPAADFVVRGFRAAHTG